MRPKQFPPWIKKRVCRDAVVDEFRSLLKSSGLNTVCRSARCPNQDECFRKRHATFLILGEVCTRKCLFCGVNKGRPQPLDNEEPGKIAALIDRIGCRRAIITSVTRDDLEDGGAAHFANCIEKIRKSNGADRAIIEVLTPDFRGDKAALKKVLGAGPDIFVHNTETVPRLYKKLRPGADYKRSLGILKEAHAYAPGVAVKSGIMVGLGESRKEILSVLRDLKKSGCSIVTIGQYLRPSKREVEVSEFIHPSVFEGYKHKALEMGFEKVSSGPFIRSSYI